jgi:hypothetical protein
VIDRDHDETAADQLFDQHGAAVADAAQAGRVEHHRPAAAGPLNRRADPAMGQRSLQDTWRHALILFELGPRGWRQPRLERVIVGPLRRIPQADHQFPHRLRRHPWIRPALVN